MCLPKILPKLNRIVSDTTNILNNILLVQINQTSISDSILWELGVHIYQILINRFMIRINTF